MYWLCWLGPHRHPHQWFSNLHALAPWLTAGPSGTLCEILKFCVKFLHMDVYIVWQRVKKNLTDQMIHCDVGEGK